MANKVYVARETATKWQDTAGNLVMTLKNLAAGAGRVGARLDLGENSTPEDYEVRITVQFETQPVVGETVDVYLSTSDGTQPDGEIGAADAAVTENELKNLNFIGSLVVTTTDADHDMTASFIARVSTRYVSAVVFNNTVDNLQDTDDTGEVTITPIPPESQ